MAFGQQSGPPATARQVRDLLELLRASGHADFRDARGPLGFTQRQAAGKFTRGEADAYIGQLQSSVDAAASLGGAGPTGAAPVPTPARVPPTERALRAMPAERLAAELQRRGWVVMEP
jgi:hypothetical protein